jgi:hypothetical protein
MASNRLRTYLMAASLGGAVVVLSGGGCATSNNPAGFDGGNDGSSSSSGGSSGGMDGSMFSDGNGDDSPFSNDSGCAANNYRAQYSPLAMLFVLDGSGTMAASNKYAFAQQAIVAAMDEDAFNSAYLGLLMYPTGNGTLAQDCGIIPAGTPITCTVSGLAQVPLQLAGMNKSSDPSGVRHDMYNQLAASAPNQTGLGDGNPSYDAIDIGINLLDAWPKMGKRVLFFMTDGGASCTSQAMPARMSYQDANGCGDWEVPDNIINLVTTAHGDPMTPINSIFVGVPGADTDGSDPTTQPPYHVKLALSAMGHAGSPETEPKGCNGTTYTQAGGDPTMPCHFDMSQNYSAKILADAINSIRGQLLGCTFDLPVPDGGMLDPTKVNVEYSLDGGMTFTSLYKRASMSNTCTTDGCWDYTSGQKQVQLIGKACTDVTGNPNADVEIVVGCQTIIK